MFLEPEAIFGCLAVVKKLICVLGSVLVGACAQSDPLTVKPFQLRDEHIGGGDEPMARMEKSRRLYGAVSASERHQRLGQYYTFLWNDPVGVGSAPVEAVFEYQQGATASMIKRCKVSFPPGQAQGKAEFRVVGDDYFKGGRVLAWRATLMRGDRIISTQRSYLWR